MSIYAGKMTGEMTGKYVFNDGNAHLPKAFSWKNVWENDWKNDHLPKAFSGPGKMLFRSGKMPGKMLN